ncbi:MAG: peptidylprolyl isomerase [Terriglobia bacterium]
MYRLFRKGRQKLYKYLMIFFLGIVSIGMVITLAPLPNGGGQQLGSNVLAKVEGTSISVQDLQRSIDSELRNSQYGNDPKIVAALAGTALDQMVMQRALLSQGEGLGLEVTNQELLNQLRRIPYLYVDGAFIGMERYQDLIQQQTGMSVSQFEAQLRQSILLNKIREVITDSVEVTPEEVHQEFDRRNSQVKIDYVVFDPAQFVKDVKVTPSALQDYFNKNAAHYKQPEERKVRYALITPDAVRSSANVTDADLEQYYNAHLSDYRVPERVKVAQILFKTTGKSPAEIAKIASTAQDVLVQIKKGANFGDMAKKYSEDPATAAKGGQVGWIGRGQTVKEFEDAAFAMKPGEVSNLIRTSYGFHIIQVEDKQTAHLETYDEVKESIRAQLEKQKISQAQDALANNLENQLRAKPESFDAIASKAGLTPKETPLFKYNQAVPDLGNGEAFENLAFQLRVDEAGQPLQVPMGEAVIQVAEVAPAHLPKLGDVKDQVTEDYKQAQSKALAAQRAAAFAAQAKADDFAKLAKSEGLAVTESKDFTVQQQVSDAIPGSLVASAFDLKPGATGAPVAQGDKRIVFQVVSHTPANEADFAAQKDQISEELLEQKRTLAFEVYRQSLKEALLRSGKLQINQDALKQFISSYQGS